MAAINSISIDLTKLNKEKIKDNRWWNDGNIVNAEWVERVDNSQQNQEREEVDLF